MTVLRSAFRLRAGVGALRSLGLLAVGCAQPSVPSSPSASTAPVVVAQTPPPQPAAPTYAPLVIAVVYDQLGSSVLARSLAVLDEAGAIRRTLAKGAYFERGSYPYANTLTAPGHAAIFTGAPPSVTGIGGNEVFDRATGQTLTAATSLQYHVHGRPKLKIGPERLRAQTVGQALKEQTDGRAQVVSISLKDRAAVFSVGMGATLALWYDSGLQAFTSSTFCVAELPQWVADYQQAHPVASLLEPWLPLNPELYHRLLGPDDFEGEDSTLGRVFPHEPRAMAEPYGFLKYLPAASEYLVGLAAQAVTQYAMGSDDAADLLVLSISGTDYVGHAYGPDSWEYLDHLVRADRAVGLWLQQLEQRLPISVLITSDHGVAPLIERATTAYGAASAGRVSPPAVASALEAHLDEQFGKGHWVADFLGSFIYFTKEAHADPRFARIQQSSIAFVESLEGVAKVIAEGELQRLGEGADPLEQISNHSFPRDGGADLIVHPEAYYLLSENTPGFSTHHGTAHLYDQQVPILISGPGVSNFHVADPVNQLRVAATIARLLGVAAPVDAVKDPLPLSSDELGPR